MQEHLCRLTGNFASSSFFKTLKDQNSILFLNGTLCTRRISKMNGLQDHCYQKRYEFLGTKVTIDFIDFMNNMYIKIFFYFWAYVQKVVQN